MPIQLIFALTNANLILGWIFDETGDFRNVFYIIFVTSSLAAFLLFVSSRVTIEKILSLKEKAKDVTVLENCDLATEISQSKLLGSTLAYETTV